MSATTAYLALGSNLGDRLLHLQRAVQLLDDRKGIRVDSPDGIASVWESSPVGAGEPQPDYLNTAVRITTTLSPGDLLLACLDVEQDLGRVRAKPGEARTIDVDVLLYSDKIVREDPITVPHPRLHERRFVLEPLCEIGPDVVHPVLHHTIGELTQERRRLSRDETLNRATDRRWYLWRNGAVHAERPGARPPS
jgi:2-amino-4-hydroxy-6-hydroxymethyldihydropteridine diphosphokinase